MLNKTAVSFSKNSQLKAKIATTILTTLITGSLLVGCAEVIDTANDSTINTQDTMAGSSDKTNSKNISFLAFGDGGYHHDYPKIKHVKNPRNKTEFITKEKEDWLEDHRPIEEFDHAPIYVYPNTNIATELGGGLAVGKAMTETCRTRQCDFAIQLGDNIYPDGADANDGKDDQKRMNDLILRPLQPLINENPDLMVYSALGNHDWKSSRKGVALQTEWMEKQANFHLDKKGYYQYKMGTPGNDVEFFVLDTNMLLAANPLFEIPLNSDGSEMSMAEAKRKNIGELDTPKPHESPVNGEDKVQLNWLTQGLEKSTAKWKVVYGHHILWSIGGSKYSEGHVLRKLLLPTLCKNADAYIAGHEHDLELLTDDCTKYTVAKAGEKIKPLPLIISGAASKMRGKHTPFAEQQEKRYSEYELLWSKSFVWGYAHITLDNEEDKLQVDFFTTPTDESGQVIKEASFSFNRR